jgi:hypothetical protein
VIVDAQLGSSGRLSLDFSEAIRIDLAAAAKTGKFDTLGHFLDKFIEAARDVGNDERRAGRPVRFAEMNRAVRQSAARILPRYVFSMT